MTAPRETLLRGASRLCRAGAALALLALAGCGDVHITFLDPQGPVAAQQRLHFLLILGLTLIVVLPVLVLTPWLVWRYRYGRSAMYQPEWNFGWRWEIALWGVPTVIAGILAVLLWQNTLALDPYDPVPVRGEGLHVQAIGFDWKWLFVYPELGIATVDELAFPASRPLRIDLTSETVMQSLFIPALGGQIYAMNGMVTHLDLAAYGPGRFRGGNTQYNGRGFHDQRFDAVAMTDAAFEDWTATVRADGIALDDAAYAALKRQGTAMDLARSLGRAAPPLRFHGVAPDLVERAARPVQAEATP